MEANIKANLLNKEAEKAKKEADKLAKREILEEEMNKKREQDH